MKTVKNIERWLAELESGKHKQTMDFLEHTNRFCCLGVACRFVLDLKATQLATQDSVYFTDPVTGRTSCMMMPGVSHKEFGLHCRGGKSNVVVIRVDDQEFRSETLEDYVGLTDLNDQGMSFEMIARILRQDLDADTPPFGFFQKAIYTAWKAR